VINVLITVIIIKFMVVFLESSRMMAMVQAMRQKRSYVCKILHLFKNGGKELKKGNENCGSCPIN
jgi:hypothetical protein